MAGDKLIDASTHLVSVETKGPITYSFNTKVSGRLGATGAGQWVQFGLLVSANPDYLKGDQYCEIVQPNQTVYAKSTRGTVRNQLHASVRVEYDTDTSSITTQDVARAAAQIAFDTFPINDTGGYLYCKISGNVVNQRIYSYMEHSASGTTTLLEGVVDGNGLVEILVPFHINADPF